MNRLLRYAIALAACPIIIGTFIYFTWRVTRWQWLEMMGLITILIGIVVFLAGAVCLILHLKSGSRNGHAPPLNALLVSGLLFANFPLAAFYITSAIDISTKYTVRVHNDSDQSIESFIILGPGVDTEIGPIPSGKKAIQHIHPTTDGTLKFTASRKRLKFDGELESYVSKGMGGDITVSVRENGIYDVNDTFR